MDPRRPPGGRPESKSPSSAGAGSVSQHPQTTRLTFWLEKQICYSTMDEDAETQLSPLEGELALAELVFPDFRRDRMDTAEGGGRARTRRDAFWDSVDEEVLLEAFGNRTGSVALGDDGDISASDRDLVDMMKADVEEAALQEADLIGFWVAWHRAGGFAGLERAGWHRTTIFRRLRHFRTRFGVHPDSKDFEWINLDLERSWQAQIEMALGEARGFSPD